MFSIVAEKQKIKIYQVSSPVTADSNFLLSILLVESKIFVMMFIYSFIFFFFFARLGFLKNISLNQFLFHFLIKRNKI